MLDDLKLIHERDAQDALGVAERQWQQLDYEFRLADDVMGRDQAGKLFGDRTIANIVLGGMGGSALAAAISQSWPGYDRPFEISRNYEIPAYVGPQTLFIASSYSGNTEETLAALASAEEKQAMVVVIASGGKLEEIAQAKHYPFYKIPGGLQPRHAVLYNYKALLSLMAETGLLAGTSLADLQQKIIPPLSQGLKTSMEAWLPTVPTKDNPAKQLALECIGKSIVIYAGPKLAPTAYKWKISFNENAKNIAWWNQFPELNHNEFLGWTEQPVDKPYAVIELRSNLEHPRVQKRFEITERLLSGRRPAPQVVQAQGESLVEQLLWTVALGDFVSLYTALLNGLNPTPVDLIEKLKTALND